MPTRLLPAEPSLEHLKKQAKRLRDAVRGGDADAFAQVLEFHPRASQVRDRFSLVEAQLVIARSYGFPSWTKLKQHVVEIGPFVWNPAPGPDPHALDDVFVRLACLTYLDWHPSNVARAVRMLDEHPELAAANIYTAAAVGNVAAVAGMLDRDPSAVNRKGGPLRWEPLLYACYSRLPREDGRSTLEVARFLLSRGADPNAGFLFAGHYAFTALTGAFGRGEDWPNQPPHEESVALARLLLDAGADPNDSQTLYNRHFEADDEHLEVLFAYGLGKDRGGPWLKRLGGESATPETMLVQQLCWAAMKNFSRRVKLVVQHGVDVNRPSLRSGRTAYQEALRAGNHAIAEYLLEHGAHEIGLDRVEEFAIACLEGRRDEVRRRLTKDPALMDLLGHHGRIELLHRAVEAKRPEAVRLIVELGVEVNGMVPGTGLDRSALHNAAGWGGVETVKLLIELGADPSLRDLAYNATPLGWALHCSNREVIEYLLPTAEVFDAVRAGGVERVAALLEQDPSLANARDSAGNPLIFYLDPASARLEEMIHRLITHGAVLDALNNRGRTLVEEALLAQEATFAAVIRRFQR